MSVDGDRLAEWLSRLVRIPSVSPDQAGPRAGVPGEARLGAEVARWFRELGGDVHVEEVLPGRANVYGLWEGQSERWAAVDAHLDTVGVEQMTGDPFSGRVEGGRVHGRGAVDTKATLGVVLALLNEMHRSGRRPVPNLLVATTVDEEVSARGAPAFASWVRARGIALDELAVAEPTRCGPVVGHKGGLRLEFHVEGVPAHSSQPHLGKNAITAAAHLVLAMDAEHARLSALPPAALGTPTLTVTIAHGGSGENVVPAGCSLVVDRRLLPGESGPEVGARLVELAERACPLPVRSDTTLWVDPFSQIPETPWVQQLAETSGIPPAVVPYCTNAWAYGGLARETVIIGPGSIDQAHGVEEWVEIGELEKLAGIYARWWGLTDV
ncbi:MAG TPA: M20/M25/M40 family metallo-hydrolase [Armatimonadota bacterium]|nr:M20/M25/M40 family metallo-hydrolase [Armatimonadota bacterium]